MPAPSTPPLPAASSALMHDAGFLRALTEHLPASLVVMEAPELRIVHLNAQAVQELRIDPARTLGRKVGEVFGGLLPPGVEQAMRRALRERRTVEHEFVLLEAQQRRIINARFLAVCQQDGAPQALIAIVRDVSAERRAQHELAESRLRFQEFAAAVDDGVFVADRARTRFHFLSARMLDIWGVDEAELARAPQCFFERVLPEDHEVYFGRFEREDSGEPVDVSFRVRHATRGVRWLRSRTRAQHLHDGELCVYGLITDVTDDREHELALQRTRDAAEAASQAKSQFMANMSHEIRTPMNGILGMTELLLGTPLTDKQRRFAQAVYRSGESLLEIINDILDFSRIEAGKLQLAACDFTLRGVVEDTLELLAPRAHDKRVELVFREQPGLPALAHGDPLRLRQVLTHLVANAIKFTEAGEIVVDLNRDAQPGWFRFEVRDTGIGIEPEVLPRLFTAFTQGHGGMSRRYGGIGLGLAICKQLVELMGGRIEATSTPGLGSCFGFSLPLAAAQGTQADPAGVPPPAESPGLFPPLGGGLTPALRRHILVVEDNSVNQEVVGQMLRALGCQVRVAAGAYEGLKVLCEQRFDLVLMDIQMPGMDGTEALQWFRRGPSRRFPFITPSDIPVVAITANALDGDEERFLALGFDGYLSKPFRQSQLHMMLRRRLSPAAPDDGNPHKGAGPAAPGPAQPQALGALKGVLDAQALERLRELDPTGANGLLARVLKAFEGSLQRLLQQLQDARGTADLAAMRHVAHTLKSSAASVGALELSKLCAEIERSIRQEETEGLEGLLDGMVAESARLLAALKPALESSP
ncbi:MAG: ATP-binding protein [Pseudomonadota bacterium]